MSRRLRHVQSPHWDLRVGPSESESMSLLGEELTTGVSRFISVHTFRREKVLPSPVGRVVVRPGDPDGNTGGRDAPSTLPSLRAGGPLSLSEKRRNDIRAKKT